MRKLFLVLFVFLSISIFGQQESPVYILSIDFTADQTGTPSPSYAAAYLVNSGNATVNIPFYFRTSWGQASYYKDNLYTNYISYTELVFDTMNTPTCTLKPGEKIRVFSAAFSPKEREDYYWIILGQALVNDAEKKVIAFVN